MRELTQRPRHCAVELVGACERDVEELRLMIPTGRTRGFLTTSTMQTRARQAASLPASRKGTRKRSSAESTLPTRLAKKARLTAEPPPYLNTLPSPPDVPDDLQLYIWGTGDCGQFGLGVDDAEEEITRPRLRPWTEGEAKLESVVAGGMHSLFVDQTGLVWSCGTNDNAALGRITENVEDPTRLGQFVDEDELGFRPRPVQMPEDESFRAIQAVTGDSICATVDNRGELRAWGTFHVCLFRFM